MSNERIPPSLERLRHYLELETIAWKETEPGTEVIVEALDMGTQERGSFGFTVLGLEDNQNGLTTAYVELGETDFTFVRDSDRQPIQLPPGTILRSDVACQYFPETDGTMTSFAGITVGRDYSFAEVLTPDGKVIDTVLVPRVQALYSFMPDGEYTPPASLQDYKKQIVDVRAEQKQASDEYVQQLDQYMADKLHELFDDETTIEDVMALFATFAPEGRYKLVILMEYAIQDEVTAKYPKALTQAIDEEFSMAPPGLRGVEFIPASKRGFNLMIKQLGLTVPRPPAQ